MRKYDIQVCKCGHIHAIPNEKINAAIESNKNLLLICGSCGHASLIGADIDVDMFDSTQTVYLMYRFDFKGAEDTKIITEDIFVESKDSKAISEIYYDVGIRVPMKTGYSANSYINGVGFSDTTYPDFTKLLNTNITINAVKDFIDTSVHDSNTVNMNRFINETDSEILNEISNYLIDGLDWKGTEYEKSWS